jgi:hypothetical protein
MCAGAREMWRLSKEGKLDQPYTFPRATNKMQGPFPLPGGAKGYILPLPPTPKAPAAPPPESSAAPDPPGAPGPAGSFPGAEISATADAEPPDVAADVSSLQNVEFINGFNSTNTSGGLYVYDKSGNREKFTDPVTFWCGSAGVNGQPLIGCVNGAETLHLTDTQIGFDPALGRWIATEMARDDSTGLANIYVAASLSIDATGPWEKWSEPLSGEPQIQRTMPKKRKRHAPGPQPEVLKIEGDWKDAMRKLISKKRPESGWPKPEKKKAK